MKGERVFENFEASPLCPLTVGIGATKGGGHDFIQEATGDGAFGSEMRKKQTRSIMLGAIGRVEEIGHLGSPAWLHPSAASRARPPSPRPARRA